jgi:hypothetical protein
VRGAEEAIVTWGRASYGRDVAPFLIDCSAGEKMELPDRLVELPSAVISYAAAHFRPRSLQRDQCAVLVVAVVGPDSVVQQKL